MNEPTDQPTDQSVEQSADQSAEKPTFVYVTTLDATPDQVWQALTSEPFTQHYWGNGHLESDWQEGSPVRHVTPDGNTDWQGEVLRSQPPHRLTYTVQPADQLDATPSRVRFQVEPQADRVKLILIHDRLTTQCGLSMAQQWPTHLADLKRLLERVGIPLVA
jgi:uncharacterized protein YndB with AHSA1/START domain